MKKADKTVTAPRWLNEIANETHCILCGSPQAEFIGVYESKNKGKEFGAPEGKTRLIVYRICATCMTPDHQGAAIAAEIVIHKQLGDADYTANVDLH